MSEEHDCEEEYGGCNWFVWGSKDVHTITQNPYDDRFEAIVYAVVKCEHCGDVRELVFHAET
tara:strand:- start:156 stop:341 length:186 start_codon:yes stop_codon:yes gene_type:complete